MEVHLIRFELVVYIVHNIDFINLMIIEAELTVSHKFSQNYKFLYK